ncbi:MAG: hypothetical protein HYZ93_00645 [Candidatus Omnitrophica bacterium]|nr:hypothetical protein [Candidatus Omnitrophota bacterium]
MRGRFVLVNLAAWSLVLWGAQVPASAHMRDYIFNQGYHTTRRGEFEVERYHDLNLTEADNDDTYSSKHQVELEYGLTNRLQLAYYEVFKWDRPKDWRRDSFKIEGKYRFLESGELPVDIALYGEYKNPNGSRGAASDELEGKLILSRDLGPWNLVANLIAERKINEHEDLQWEYTLGASIPVHPKVRLGLEMKETLGDQGEFGIRRKGHELQLMPVVAASPTPHVRVLFGPAFGLTRATDDLQLKSIVEVEF